MMNTCLSRWPGGVKAAISITLDNMGEALELNRGTWPPSAPLGNHESVHIHLPLILELLERHKIKATYFIESCNIEHYLHTIEHVAQQGHEVAWHGFQHEVWGLLSTDEESGLFEKSVEYARKVGITYKGFRPPGGTITSDTLCLMQKHGMKYISPVAEHAALLQSLVVLPLSWDMTDAYYYFEPLKHMRQKYGHGEDLLSPAVLKERMLATIDKLVEQGEYISLLFHPFLTTTPERRAVMEEIIEYVSKESRIWSAPCAEVADWILAHPEDFRRESGIQNSGWI